MNLDSLHDRILATLQAAIDEHVVELARLRAARAALLGADPVPIVRPQTPDTPPAPDDDEPPAAAESPAGRARRALRGRMIDLAESFTCEPISKAPFDPEQARRNAAAAL